MRTIPSTERSRRGEAAVRVMGNCPGLEQPLSAAGRYAHKGVKRDKNKTFSR